MGGERTGLVTLDGPDKVPFHGGVRLRGGHRSNLVQSLLQIISPNAPWPAAMASSTASAPKVLETASNCTASRGRPAAAQAARMVESTACSFKAIVDIILSAGN